MTWGRKITSRGDDWPIVAPPARHFGYCPRCGGVNCDGSDSAQARRGRCDECRVRVVF